MTAFVSPSRLIRAREGVVLAHPKVGEGASEAADPGALDRLRDLVLAAMTAGRLDQFAQALAPRDVRALVSCLHRFPEIATGAVMLLRARATEPVLALLWRAWQARPEHGATHDALMLVGNAVDWRGPWATALDARLRLWLSDGEFAEHMQAWLAREGLGYRDLAGLNSLPIDPESPLGILVRDAILTGGTAAQITMEAPALVRVWFVELAPDKFRRALQHYLQTLQPSDWDYPVLEDVERAFGLPRNPRVRGFWDVVSEPVKRAYQAMMVKRRLKQALGDTDRYRYWSTWVDRGRVEDFSVGHAGDTPFGVIDFGSFGVIEFFEPNHAAYFYPAQLLEQMAQAAPNSASDLKQRLTIGAGANRLIHNSAGRGWEPRAEAMVASWTRATGRS